MRILFAGGGTGGHIYPAVAVAHELKRLKPDIQIDFVGTNQGLETKIIPKEGFTLHFISAGKINRVGPLERLVSLLLIPVGIIQSISMILRLKPDVILGVGGYASGPIMLAGLLLRRKLALFECNAYPGLTNRILAPLVKWLFVNFEATKEYWPKAAVVGLPTRAGIGSEAQSKVATVKFQTGAVARPLRILVFGGSQGARGINTTVIESVRRNGEWLKKVEIVHQIGRTDYQKNSHEYADIVSRWTHRGEGGVFPVQWFEFLYDMPLRYQWADLVICRAGASTLAELALAQKASVLVPLPTAADDHQKKNADALAVKNAALVIEQKDFTPERLVQLIEGFIADPKLLVNLENSIVAFKKPTSAADLAQALLKTQQALK